MDVASTTSPTVDSIKEIIQLISQLIIVLIPIIAATYFTVRKKFNLKIKELQLRDLTKRKQELLSFSHEKSLISMKNLKEICNLYFDKSKANRVLYYQLENGTTADSLLQNMFITCMAESDRYSELPEWSSKVQRSPAQIVITLLEYLNSHQDSLDLIFEEDLQNILDARSHQIFFSPDVDAARFRIVRNPSGYIVGYVIFEYKFSDSHDLQDFKDSPGTLATECKAAIEAELVRYRLMIHDKKLELNLD